MMGNVDSVIEQYYSLQKKTRKMLWVKYSLK